MSPEQVKVVLRDWHDRLSGHDIQFAVRDYRSILSRPGDFLYLDPPYTIERPKVYYGRFDLQPFFRGWASSRPITPCPSTVSSAARTRPSTCHGICTTSTFNSTAGQIPLAVWPGWEWCR